MSNGSRPRVLVFDNLVDAADSTALLLKLWGYDVVTVHDGATALVTARTFRPHVVLLEVHMPGLNGFELARRLRAETDLADNALIALSWSADAGSQLRARAMGIRPYLLKPVDPEYLQLVIEARICPELPETGRSTETKTEDLLPFKDKEQSRERRNFFTRGQ